MPLHRKNWFCSVFYSFNGFVVGVHEPAFERCFFEAVHFNGVSVVLCGNIAAVRFEVECGLVLAAVTELQFICVSAHGKHEYLVSKADAHRWHFLREFLHALV